MAPSREEDPSLEDMVRGVGPLESWQLLALRRWVAADWESHDIDRDAVKAIGRLLDTIDHGAKR